MKHPALLTSYIRINSPTLAMLVVDSSCILTCKRSGSLESRNGLFTREFFLVQGPVKIAIIWLTPSNAPHVAS